MPSGHSGEPRAGLPACTWNGLTGWTADGARGGLDFPSSRMQVRTRTVQCTQVLAELPIANCRGLGVREGGKEHRAETSPCITFWAPAQLPQGYLPYPAVPGSSHTHRRGPSRLGRHGLSTRPSTHATGTAASFPQACRLSLAAHVRKHVQAPSSAAFRHEQSSTQSPAVFASLLSYCGSLYARWVVSPRSSKCASATLRPEPPESKTENHTPPL